MFVIFIIVLVIAWAFFVIILKCKREHKPFDNSTTVGGVPVHVIQINDNLFGVMPATATTAAAGGGNGTAVCRQGMTRPYHACTRTCTIPCPYAGAVTNPSFLFDEYTGTGGGAIYPQTITSEHTKPPPSYEEVLRMPTRYPVIQTGGDTSSSIS